MNYNKYKQFRASYNGRMLILTMNRPDEPMLCLVDAKRIVFSLLDLEKAVIVAVTGHAMGLGATIALLCDTIFLCPQKLRNI